MKKPFFIFILLFLNLSLSAQQEKNLPFLFNWDDNSLPYSWIVQYNDCWGYASGGREYAILGGIEGTYFFDVTDPFNTTFIDFQIGKDQIGMHRDYKTYQHYAYAVSDEGNSSLQVFDLQYLPDSVVKVYDSDTLCVRSHNIFINNGKLYLAGVTTLTQTYPMSVFSLADPENPTLLKNLTGMPFSYVHDVCVRNDTAFASCGSDGLYIIDFIDPVNPALVQSITSYPEQGYNHSSWISEDGKTLVFADETHGCGLKVYDVSNILNPVLQSTIQSNLLNEPSPKSAAGSIPHNPFILGNLVFISYYHDGVQVFDISDRTNPVQVAWYDTNPFNADYSSYAGAWGVYPYLPSGNILGSDIDNGLFVLDGSSVISDVKNLKKKNSQISLYPNPAKDRLRVSLKKVQSGNVKIVITDIAGRKVGEQNIVINANDPVASVSLEGFKKGIYFISLSSGTFSATEKFLIQ
jgi:choice-of-anchor B domain-containing protein